METNHNDLFVQRDMGIYVHIPFCKQKCIYCDFPAYQNLEEYYDTYIYALLQEITMFGDTYPKARTKLVDTVYLGGGTPTELSLSQIEKIINTIQRTYNLSNDCRFTIESNPGEIDISYLKGLQKLGFSRISFGVQTFNDTSLLSLYRSHNSKAAIDAVQWAAEVGFTDINIDLIYGLPKQTIEEIKENITLVSKLPINHISTYGLQVERGTRLYHLVEKELISLPDESLEDRMYETMMQGIQELGFERYEISNFAKNGAYSTHNLKYWQYSDYLGFGAGAHSFFEGIRRANNRNVMPYARKIDCFEFPIVDEEIIDEQRAIEDYCFLALRTKWGINTTVFFEKFNVTLDSIYGSILQELIEKDLIVKDGKSYHLTSEGTKHGNYVFSQFIEG
ncbi:radical SAM family heme chaperone HemW [Veillonella tobetsuensis]|uniref:Heme chaperone HemW n=1 Tax=Veillonella tobetsuensis TaxID=1110546 RepID=A0A480AZ76_9FIRM|nr:radical SAM family heme chaperone HemW [Veillonella tobetsuensis]GCL66663.1 coproporphyrinogen III oxidase [Veillonella tobetsuensis]